MDGLTDSYQSTQHVFQVPQRILNPIVFNSSISGTPHNESQPNHNYANSMEMGSVKLTEEKEP